MLTEGIHAWQPHEKISPEICQSIIDLAKQREFIKAAVLGSKGNADYNSDIRQGASNFNNQQWVYDLIWPYMVEANKEAGWNFDISSAESYQIGKYEVGDYYKTHIDSLGTHGTKWIAEDNPYLHNKVRKISMSLILNDDYEGGDIIIFGVNKIKKETGNMIFFPSYLAHEVTPVTKGTRYSLVMWFLGNPWR